MTCEVSDSFRLPRVDWEAAPTAGLASIEANGNGDTLSRGEFVAESTFGGVVVSAIYQTLLTGLRAEALRQRGMTDRATQVHTIAMTVWETSKQGALVSVFLGVLLLVFAWLGWPLTLLGFMGMGQDQQAKLMAASDDASVYLRRCLDGEQGADSRGMA